MSQPSFDTKHAHRWFGIAYNNATWTLVEKADRSDTESEEMIHSAHAAFIHWKSVGTPINTLRAYNLLTYAYAMIGNGATASHYSNRTMDIFKTSPKGLADFDAAFVYDAASRAYSASGENEKADEYKVKAKEAGEEIQNEGDRTVFMTTFAL